MRHLKLIASFFKVSTQAELAYRSNFFIRLLNSFLSLGTGVLSLVVIFNQVETINGWSLPGTLALLGIYLLLGGLRGLFISPSLESVAGMDGEIWQGTFDFTMLRPVDKQFLVSFRNWRIYALFDVALALCVLIYAIILLGETLSLGILLSFLLMLLASVILLYSSLLAFSALVFWNSGFLFTWIINDLFQLARYTGWCVMAVQARFNEIRQRIQLSRPLQFITQYTQRDNQTPSTCCCETIRLHVQLIPD